MKTKHLIVLIAIITLVLIMLFLSLSIRKDNNSKLKMENQYATQDAVSVKVAQGYEMSSMQHADYFYRQ